jgi:SNF2 family DNA or RNA helicase
MKMPDTLRLKKVFGHVVGFEVVSENASNMPRGYVDIFKPEKSNLAEYPPVPEAYEHIINYYASNGLKLVVHNNVHQYIAANKHDLNEAAKFGVAKFLSYHKLQYLYTHQKQGLIIALLNYYLNGNKLRLLFADDPRLGKSAQALAALDTIGITGHVLVLCPKSLVLQWVDYINTWVRNPRIVTLIGTTPQKMKQWACYDFLSGPTFVITNWESLYGLTELFNVEWFALIGDEAHKLKNKDSKVVAAVKKLTTTHIALLSATFVENLPDQWWSPLSLIKPELFTSFWRWAGYYTKLQQGYGVELVEPKNINWLRSHVAPYVLQRKSDGVVDMPVKLIEQVTCALDDDHRRFYEQLKISLWVKLSEHKTINIVNKVSLMTRLRQACLHPFLLDETNKLELETGKFATLRTLVTDYIPEDEQVIVYSSFVGACFAAKFVLEKHTPTFIYAGTHSDMNEVQHFQQGNYRVMVATPQKGGVGLNLYNADWVIYLDMPWSTIDIRQSEERVRAIGKTKPVTIKRLVAHDTIDEYVLTHVLNKLQNASASEIVEAAFEYLKDQ